MKNLGIPKPLNAVQHRIFDSGAIIRSGNLLLWAGAVALTLSLLAGCSTSLKPIAQAPAKSNQPVMVTALHWDVMAQHFANGIAGLYAKLPNASKRPVFVAEANKNSTFGRAFHNLVIGHLLKKSVPITTKVNRADCLNPAQCAPLTLNYETILVRHAEKEGFTLPLHGPTLPQAAAYVLHFAGDYWMSPAWSVLPLSAHIENKLPEDTNTEIIASASLLNGDQVLFADSKIYYVNDPDYSQYAESSVHGLLDSPTPSVPVLNVPASQAHQPNSTDLAVRTALLNGCATTTGNAPSYAVLFSRDQHATYEFTCHHCTPDRSWSDNQAVILLSDLEKPDHCVTKTLMVNCKFNECSALS